MADKGVQIGMRVEEDLRDDLQKLAKESGRSFSDECRRGLRWYVMNVNLGKIKDAAA